MVAKYPRYIKEENIGESVEKRPITVLHLADFESDQPKTQVLFAAMAHGREAPTTLVALTYVADWLDRLDKKDPEAIVMSLHRKVSVHWCSNPDTYIANENFPPSLIRKNRNPNKCPGQSEASMGVDLNRNFPMYGVPPGNTVYECGETYNGGAPFSEPETLAAKKLVESNNFTFAINVHAYGDMLILPSDLKADDRTFCDEMVPDWIKLYGTDMETVGYKAPGAIDDYWYKGHNILGMCLEVGDAFWPSNQDKAGFLSRTTPFLRHSVVKGGCTPRIVKSGSSVAVRNDGKDACQPLKVSGGPNKEDVVDVGELAARSSRDVAVKGSTICMNEAGVPFCLCGANEIGGGVWKTEDDAICKSLIDSSSEDNTSSPATESIPDPVVSPSTVVSTSTVESTESPQDSKASSLTSPLALICVVLLVCAFIYFGFYWYKKNKSDTHLPPPVRGPERYIKRKSKYVSGIDHGLNLPRRDGKHQRRGYQRR